MLPEVRLSEVSRENVRTLAEWLHDPEVNASWFGNGELGEPLHTPYSLKEMLESTPDEWKAVFDDAHSKVYSVYTGDGEYIGEAQLIIDAILREAQLSILIGRKDLWYRGYGTAGLIMLLDLAFYTYNLHRAWVDVPEYNLPAIHVCERIGFVLEGRLRSTRLKDGQWYDSMAMGLLVNEYARRRARVVEGAGEPAG